MANYTVTTDTTYYINSGSGNDATGDGSAGAPWKTIAGGMTQLKKQLIAPGVRATLSLANGTYSGTTFAEQPFIVKILGNQSSPASTYVSGNIDIYQNASVETSYVKMNAMTCYYGGLGVIQTGSILAATIYSQIYASDGGIIRINGSYTCQGNCSQHVIAESFGAILCDSGLTLTLVGTPNYSDKFALALRGGLIRFHRYGGTRLAFSGTATGPRYLSTDNSVIDTLGGGGSYLPGNTAGSTNAGGIYI
jgi:hypothetical protein